MITESLSTLKIHKLTQEQYERELAAGRIDENAFYLTPEEEIDFSPYATTEDLKGKADVKHSHNVSDITNFPSSLPANGGNADTVGGKQASDFADATEFNKFKGYVGDSSVYDQIVDGIANKSDVGHNHDEAYDKKGAANTALSDAKKYADQVKNDLLNGAGTAYDTLKELGDLITEDRSAIDALEVVAANKANASDLAAHTGNGSNPHGVTAAQVGAVPTTRTVNGKALSANITLSASDVGADASGAANTSLSDAKKYTDGEFTRLVGDTKVSTQISTAIASKSDVGHGHDDRYYTESEIDTKLSGKANSSHGNHVPATQTANNAKFLRNDNTWQTVTPANIGAAAASHGTHVSYSTANPTMDGTASVGSSGAVARADHRHPTDTSRAAASDLSALQNLVGDTKVETQISNAIANKSNNGHTHDDRYYTESEINTKLSGKSDSGHTHTYDSALSSASSNAVQNKAIVSALDGKSNVDHTHTYAGASSSGGSATSAVKLDSSAGSATQPVYFSGGKPVATTYTLGASVPSGAKFTDTTYNAATQSAAGLMSAADKKKLDGLSTAKVMAFYGVALNFDANGVATYTGNSTSTFTGSSVVVCSRRAGSAQNDIFTCSAASGVITIRSNVSKSTTINVNIIVVNP